MAAGVVADFGVGGAVTDWTPPVQRTDLMWAAVDFDGTLAESLWTPDNPTALPGAPIWKNTKKLVDVVAKGWKPVIHTSRPSSDYELIESWLTFYGVPFKQIVTGKLLAGLYIDDRAVNADEESWV